ncbi:interleukin-15 [Odontesthes bonariensis]|uniref:interleukin-15 n=1 Tax=Odontesthes bonariensis TaxID=219752 RepID=UPI003F587E26
MTDFMTALLVILFQLACSRDQRAKDAQFQLTCNLCRDSHKTQVYLCFLILSLLSICTHASHETEIEDLKQCMEELKGRIEKSTAMLYAPSVNDNKENCNHMALKCYMLELMMVVEEEEITHKTSCIYTFNSTLRPEVGCPPCETYSLQNITIFMNRLTRFLEKVNTEMIHET